MGSGGISPDGQSIVQPDEEFELKFSDEQYRNTVAFFVKHAGSANFTKVWIGITTIKFDDATIWGNGCLRAINPRASCTSSAS
jgi:hypothetical protein